MTALDADPRPPGVPALSIRVGARCWRLTPDEPARIGRDPSCDVPIEDRRVSRHHATVEYRDGWLVRDVASANGTWLDGRRIRRHRLDRGAAIRLGDPVTGVPVLLDLGDEPAPVGASSLEGVTIGRALDNDVVLNDLLVSRHHARIEQMDGRRRVVDLGSRNRILVNGVPADQPLPVAHGDRLTVGNTDLVVDGDGLLPVSVSRSRLVADGLGYTLPGGRDLLRGVDLDIGPGTLLAVVGPSGAGKSTLLRLLTGQQSPTTGQVSYDGYDVHRDLGVVRRRIGVVPQEDVVHRRLTPRQALAFTARLRLPEDISAAERRSQVAAALAELGLTEHADTRIDRLSGGQRKRVSIALELLTAPSLLILDEPTSGLDPALDRQLMAGLRAIADAGRIVVVVTHNVTNLDVCDRLLLLAPGGVPVYAGTPGNVLGQFGTLDWADILTRVSADPAGAHEAYRGAAGRGPVMPAATRAPAAAEHAPARWVLRQAATVAVRQVRLILADPGYALSLLLLPLVLAALAAAVPGHAGLRRPAAATPGELGQVLVLLFVGAAFMGGAAAAREVVGEKAIYLRERAAGLHPLAYLAAKVAVLAAICAGQSTALVAAVLIAKPGPAGAALLRSGAVELTLAAGATALASGLLSLLFSALVRSGEQVMPVLVVTVMAQLVLCGGMIPVTSRPGLSQLSWLAPARWGFAAGAATTDLRAVPGTPADALWRHTPGAWLLAGAVLAGYGGCCATLVLIRLRRLRSV